MEALSFTHELRVNGIFLLKIFTILKNIIISMHNHSISSLRKLIDIIMHVCHGWVHNYALNLFQSDRLLNILKNVGFSNK